MLGSVSSLLVSPAQAQPAAGAPSEASPLAGLLPFLLIVVVFYFLIIRPQGKRFKEHAAMVKGLKKGDRVVTGGGIIGKVTKAETGSETVLVEIAPGVAVEVSRATVTARAGDAAAKELPQSPASKRKKAAATTGEKENVANDN